MSLVIYMRGVIRKLHKLVLASHDCETQRANQD